MGSCGLPLSWRVGSEPVTPVSWRNVAWLTAVGKASRVDTKRRTAKPADDWLGRASRMLTHIKWKNVLFLNGSPPNHNKVKFLSADVLLCVCRWTERITFTLSVCCPWSDFFSPAEKAATTENKIWNGTTLQYEVSYPEYVSHLSPCDSPTCIWTPDYKLCTHTQDFFMSSSSAQWHTIAVQGFFPRITQEIGSFCIIYKVTSRIYFATQQKFQSTKLKIGHLSCAADITGEKSKHLSTLQRMTALIGPQQHLGGGGTVIFSQISPNYRQMKSDPAQRSIW